MIKPIAQLRVTLRGTTPEIWRRLDVPLSTSLLSLHHIIQIAMGWKDTHGFNSNTVAGVTAFLTQTLPRSSPK